jgi:hypothetical protein
MNKKLFLGVSRINITPEVGCNLFGYAPDVIAESVHDDLTATAFYFKSGATEALLISLSICLLHTKLSNEIASLIEEKYNIPKENCIIHCTHTHSGPNVSGMVGWGDIDRKYYNEIFLPNVMQVVSEAKSSPVAVKMAVATGESFIGINRRQLFPDNRVHLGQNPWGPVDPTMTVISFISAEDKTPVANLIHYGCHGTAAGHATPITRDWSGIMVDRMETETGAFTMYINGAEGDVGPRLSNGKTVGDISLMTELGGVAAGDAVTICKVKLNNKGGCSGSEVDPELSYVVTHEQGRNSKGTNWSSSCTVNYKYTFDMLTNYQNYEGGSNGIGSRGVYFPITCAALRQEDTPAATAWCEMKDGVITSNYHIVSTTVGSETVYTNTAALTGSRAPCLSVKVADVHKNTGDEVTVLLSNGVPYTFEIGG